MATMIPESLSIVLADLDFLSKIEKNMKPCYKDRVLVDAGSWVGAFYRLCRGESRKEVMEHIEKTIKNTVEAINNTQYNEHMGLIINSLYNANKGVINLAHTYESDSETTKDINEFLKEIAVHLYRYQYLIKDLQKPEVRTGEVRNAEVRNAEVRTGEVRNAEMRTGEVRNAEMRTGEVRTGEMRTGEVRNAEVRTGEVRTGEVRTGEEISVSPVSESTEPKFKRPPKMKKAFDKRNM